MCEWGGELKNENISYRNSLYEKAKQESAGHVVEGLLLMNMDSIGSF